MWNMKISRIIIIMYILIYYSSCGFLDFTPVEVGCPRLDGDGYFDGVELELEFSHEPDLVSLKELVVLKRDGVRVDSLVRLEGGRALVMPTEPWQRGVEYSLGVEGQLELVAGGSHGVSFYRRFWYGRPGEGFSLLEWTAPAGAGGDAALVLEFDCGVDMPSFAKSFSLEPKVDYRVHVENQGRRVVVVPQEGWPVNTRFLWKLSRCQSSQQVLLDKSYQDDFVWAVDIQIPVLEGVYSLGLDGTSLVELGSVFDRQPLVLVFSKEMDFDSVRSGLQVEPGISGELYPGADGRRFVWMPAEHWSLEGQYRVVLDSSVKDVSGLPLGQQEQRFFSSFNEYLQVQTIVLGDGEAEAGRVDFADEESFFREIIYKSYDDELKIITAITFSQPLSQDLLYQALDSVTMEPFFPVTGAYPILEMARRQGDHTLVLHWSGFSPSTTDVDNFYQLKISGGASGPVTDSGCYLKEDVCLVIQL